MIKLIYSTLLVIIGTAIVIGMLVPESSKESGKGTQTAKAATVEPATPSLQERAEAAYDKQDWLGAAELYEGVIEEEPENGIAWFRRAFAMHTLGLTREAIPIHQQAAQFPRFRVVALYNLACAFALEGETDQAFEALRQSIDAGWRDARHMKRDRDLISLQNNPEFTTIIERIEEIRSITQLLSFWIGNWRISDDQGQELGSGSITFDDQRAQFVQRWMDSKGQLGYSVTYYNDLDHQWYQKFTDTDKNTYIMTGTFEGTSLVLQGERTTDTQADRHDDFELRTAVRPLKKDRVRQLVEFSDDGGVTWRPLIDFYFSRDFPVFYFGPRRISK